MATQEISLPWDTEWLKSAQFGGYKLALNSHRLYDTCILFKACYELRSEFETAFSKTGYVGMDANLGFSAAIPLPQHFQITKHNNLCCDIIFLFLKHI